MGTGPQSCIGGINKDSMCDLVVVREEMTPPSNSLSSYFEMIMRDYFKEAPGFFPQEQR